MKTIGLKKYQVKELYAKKINGKTVILNISDRQGNYTKRKGWRISKLFAIYQPDPNRKLCTLVHRKSGLPLFTNLTILKASRLTKYIEMYYKNFFEFNNEKDFHKRGRSVTNSIMQDIRSYKDLM